MSTRGAFLVWLALPLCMLLGGTTIGYAQRGAAAPAARAPQGRGGGAAQPAGPIPRRPDGKPDLTGRWNGLPPDYPEGQMPGTMILEAHPAGFALSAGPSLIIDPKDGIIPYQPWALAERNRRREPENAYEDPGAHCEVGDIGLEGARGVNSNVFYADNGDIIIEVGGTTRVVDMHRTLHLPAGIRLWVGDQLGHWEGDTLVVDVTNLNGKERMAHGGDFYSANAHLVERWTMKDANTIIWTLTITDPTVFTRPWTMQSPSPLRRVRGGRNFDGENTCHEQNVDIAHMKNLYDQAHGGKAPWPPVYPQGPASASSAR